MNTDISILNIGLAFLEGLVLIISPCILPILPIILSGSLEGGKKRPLGIIIGFVLAFTLFTYFSRSLIQLLGIDLSIIRNISFILLILFGIIMISDYLTEKFSFLTHKIADVGLNAGNANTSTGFFSGLGFGVLVGLIWTPCAGPILAAVIVQTVVQKTSLSSFFTVLAFGIGAALPMLIIALAGKELIQSLKFLRKRAVLIRKILGVLIIASVIFMYFGEELTIKLTTSITSPMKGDTVTTQNISSEKTNEAISQNAEKLINPVWMPYPAPAIEGITAWINSPPLNLKELRGKVVLIDFWAYSCINCIRTLPYLKDWYQKYHDKGFVIIGVHSPEFQFEADLNNVKMAVEKDGILYPVALDNNFVTWNNYHNLYWPSHFLINKEGKVVYHHHGEGDYDITEHNIQVLLGMEQVKEESNKKTTSESLSEIKYSELQTPETYLGYARADQFKSPESIAKNSEKFYSFPSTLPQDAWALEGSWIINAEKIVSASSGNSGNSGNKTNSIKLHFYAKKVYAVMGSSNNQPILVKVTLKDDQNNKSLDNNLKTSNLKVTHHDLYTLIELKEPIEGILELIIEDDINNKNRDDAKNVGDKGLEIYTFTFGL